MTKQNRQNIAAPPPRNETSLALSKLLTKLNLLPSFLSYFTVFSVLNERDETSIPSPNWQSLSSSPILQSTHACFSCGQRIDRLWTLKHSRSSQNNPAPSKLGGRRGDDDTHRTHRGGRAGPRWEADPARPFQSGSQSQGPPSATRRARKRGLGSTSRLSIRWIALYSFLFDPFS